MTSIAAGAALAVAPAQSSSARPLPATPTPEPSTPDRRSAPQPTTRLSRPRTYPSIRPAPRPITTRATTAAADRLARIAIRPTNGSRSAWR